MVKKNDFDVKSDSRTPEKKKWDWVEFSTFKVNFSKFSNSFKKKFRSKSNSESYIYTFLDQMPPKILCDLWLKKRPKKKSLRTLKQNAS